jgi:hypothetical protein
MGWRWPPTCNGQQEGQQGDQEPTGDGEQGPAHGQAQPYGFGIGFHFWRGMASTASGSPYGDYIGGTGGAELTSLHALQNLGCVAG